MLGDCWSDICGAREASYISLLAVLPLLPYLVWLVCIGVLLRQLQVSLLLNFWGKHLPQSQALHIFVLSALSVILS